jgi:transposase
MDDRTLWVGVDLGNQTHQFCVLNASRKVVLQRAVEHKGIALSDAIERLVDLAEGQAERLQVALETPQSAVVEMLVERGIAVFTINPKQLDRFRDRHSTAGAKDDRRDAFVLADSLSTDQALFKRVKLGSAELVELRALSRIRDELLEETNALSNRIEAELVRFYPEILSVGSIQSDLWMVELLELVPTPERARKVRAPQMRMLLKKHRVRKISADDLLPLLRSSSVSVAPGVAESCGRHIEMLIPRLRLAREQEQKCHQDMQRMLDALSEPEPEIEGQRDAAIVQSLPGAGTIVSATLLAEAWQPLAERDYARLRVLSGVAPVTKQSGKSKTVSMRYACNPRLRRAVYHWANCSVRLDARSKMQYAALRAKGHTHGRALRAVADRLLGLLVTLLKRGERFDPARRALKAA